MGKTKKKPVLMIAGPGAGKTHDMVDKIIDAIPHLKDNRILGVITYTNAATINIKEKLAKKMCIPSNVFIGTNHSFCYRFIFKPFGHLIGLLPNELVFMDIDYGSKPKGTDTVSWKKEINIRKKRNLENGMFGYDQIVSMSGKILDENKLVRSIVCNRLQYLFIDEFQDANSAQFKIIDSIRKEDKTYIYAVGDPEQYIFRFTDTITSYENIAFNKLKGKSEIKRNKKNHRSCDEIVGFINNFHCEIVQISEKGSDKRGGVYYISGTDLDSIIKSYKYITKILEGKNTSVVKYYLSYANKTFEKVAEKWGLKPISNDSIKILRLIDESLNVISSMVGINNKQICECYKLEKIELRKKAFYLLKAVREGKVNNEEDIEDFIKKNLGLRINRDHPRNKILDNLKKMQRYESMDDTISECNMYSTIHKAKGLEADAVLAIAENKKQLNNWILTDKNARFVDKKDICRIGYVAFSRAKTILCIACLENIDATILKQLKYLNVKYIDYKEITE